MYSKTFDLRFQTADIGISREITVRICAASYVFMYLFFLLYLIHGVSNN